MKSPQNHRLMVFIHQNTSISFASRSQHFHSKLDQLISQKKALLHFQQQKSQQCRNLISYRTQRKQMVKEELASFQEKSRQMQEAAICLQRYIRGYLARIRFQPVVIHKRVGVSNMNVVGLVTHTTRCFQQIGNRVQPAAEVIQRAYRVFLFKRKLQRLQKCYQRFLQQKVEKAEQHLKKYLSLMACQQKIKALKFERYKWMRLEQIKRRLAVLVIKKNWRKLKLTFRVVKQRLVKIKRRKAALLNKQQMALINREKQKKKSAAPQMPPEPQSPGEQAQQEEKPQSEQSDSDASMILGMSPQQILQYKKQKAQRLRLRQIRISQGKLAYNIKQSKEKYRFPIMQEQALKQDQEEPPTILSSTRSTIDKHMFCFYTQKPLFRNTMIASPRRLSVKGGCSNDLPPLALIDRAELPQRPRTKSTTRSVTNQHFLATTVATVNRINEPPYRNKAHRRVVSRYSHYKPVKLFEQTISSSNKQQNKKKSASLQPWVPIAYRKSQYVPGIDNPWYTPKQWSRTPYSPRRDANTSTRVSTSPVYSIVPDSFRTTDRSGTANSPRTKFYFS